MQVTLYESVTKDDAASRTALVAFGANLPSGETGPAEAVLAAREALVAGGLRLLRFSRLYRTPAFPEGAGPDYVNAAAAFGLAADMAAEAVLALLHRTEAAAGRVRGQRWGARVLDLDLLAVGALVLPDAATQDRWRALPPQVQAQAAPDRLILPHPRLQDRAFVLVPLADVAPDWVHPRTGQSVASMLAALPASDRAAVTPI